jgi:hypothetical protein
VLSLQIEKLKSVYEPPSQPRLSELVVHVVSISTGTDNTLTPQLGEVLRDS